MEYVVEHSVWGGIVVVFLYICQTCCSAVITVIVRGKCMIDIVI